MAVDISRLPPLEFCDKCRQFVPRDGVHRCVEYRRGAVLETEAERLSLLLHRVPPETPHPTQ